MGAESPNSSLPSNAQASQLEGLLIENGGMNENRRRR